MITVVKLGGSLLSTGVMQACLDRLEQYPGKILIVPGGGVFADQVRKAQVCWGFDDHAAHRMAILAMQQMALLINSLKPGFALFQQRNNIEQLARILIWSPHYLELDNAGISAGWDITSDSLAAWLAGRVLADELIVVKSCPLPADASVSKLQAQGVIDSGFSRFLDNARFKLTIINHKRFLACP